MPNEVVQATQDLSAKALLPVHSSKFTLGNHDWDEPLTRVTQYAAQQNVRTLTPLIGQLVNVKDTLQVFDKWWESVQ